MVTKSWTWFLSNEIIPPFFNIRKSAEGDSDFWLVKQELSHSARSPSGSFGIFAGEGVSTAVNKLNTSSATRYRQGMSTSMIAVAKRIPNPSEMAMGIMNRA
jgi:hypothetical protein